MDRNKIGTDLRTCSSTDRAVGRNKYCLSNYQVAYSSHTGTANSESLARVIPLDDRDLKATEIKFGFKYRTILQGCIHIALWTKLDILPTCVAPLA
jgi:hypothetical protein